jgi:hypothetical protein
VVERRALLQETQMLSHQLQTRHHGDEQRLRVRGVVSLRDELFEQLPLTFHASLALEHVSAHLAELIETLGLEPLASVAQGRGDVGQLPLHFGGRTLGDLLLCWEKTDAMEYGLSLASRAFNANHTAVPLIGRTIA